MNVESPAGTPERRADAVARYRTWVTGFVTLLFLSGFFLAAVDFNRYANGGVILIGSLMGMVILGTLLLALDSRRAWALDAATRICMIVIVLGVLRTLLELQLGRINIPLDAIAGLAVLSRRPSQDALPRLGREDRGTAILVALGFLATSSLWFVAALLQGPTAR